MSINRRQGLDGVLSSKVKIAGKVAIGNFIEDNTQTFILVDEDGNEIPAVFVDEEVVITATPHDIRVGTTAITGDGVTVGEKIIPAYITEEGRTRIAPGDQLIIGMYSDMCQYTRLQVIVCAYNKSISESVAAEMVVINDYLYNVRSVDAIAPVIVDTENQTINLGIINDSDNYLVIRYFTYMED